MTKMSTFALVLSWGKWYVFSLGHFVECNGILLNVMVFNSLGIAYAGSAREDVMELLLPIVSDTTLNMELVSVAALSLGHIFVGTCNGDITSTILQILMERDEKHFKDTYCRFLGLGLALLYLGS